MQNEFQYVINLAKQYQQYVDNPESLFQALNEKDSSILEAVLIEYGNPDKKLQPVNLLRAEIARLILDGSFVTQETVEDIMFSGIYVDI